MPPPPMDEKLYDQLVAYLAARAKVREDFGAGILTLHEHDGRTLDPPMRLHLTVERFAEHLRATETEAARHHPEVSPIEAAWNRFVDQMWDAVSAAGPEEIDLVLSGDGVAAQRPHA